MRFGPVCPCKPFPPLHIAFLAALTLLLSGWTTCNAMFLFDSCQGSIPQPQISSLSPGTISLAAESVLLTVNGSGFASPSQILWNGSALQTTFVDSHHLQTAITRHTFESGERCADFRAVAGVDADFGMSQRRKLCHADAGHQLEGTVKAPRLHLAAWRSHAVPGGADEGVRPVRA